MDKNRTFAAPGVQAKECPSVPAAAVGVSGSAAEDCDDVLRANVSLEGALFDGVAVDNEGQEFGVARLVEGCRVTLTVANPIIGLRSGAYCEHDGECDCGGYHS